MAQPYVGEIRMFAGNFAPAGWMFCDGTILPISEYETLFILIGTTYGGDGQSTFALPDLRGRVPIHQHQAAGFVMGATGGTETVTLTVQQIPAHTHTVMASNAGATSNTPAGNIAAVAQGDVYASGFVGTNMNAGAISTVGGSQPHNNLQPFLCVSYIISLYGIYPSPT